MTRDRKKPGVAFWATVVLVVVLVVIAAWMLILSAITNPEPQGPTPIY